MEVNIHNSINRENDDNEGNSNTSKRQFSNSDLEFDYSYIINMEQPINEEIYQENNNNHNNEDNENNDNHNDEDNENNNNINANVNDNINNLSDSFSDGNNNNNNIKEKKIEPYILLLNELINDNHIFKKDYYDQKIDDNNKLYKAWLTKIYNKLKNESINIKNTKEDTIENNLETNNIKHITINQKTEYALIKKELEKSLYFCVNPGCNAIVYMNKKHEDSLKKIKDCSYDEPFEYIRGYNKVRCPLCLTYKCIYCNRASTFYNANCCLRQLIVACTSKNNHLTIKYYYCIFKFVIFAPIIRVAYISIMINFLLFRALTLENKLLQRKEKIIEMMNGPNNTSAHIFGTYQSKFKRIPMIIISILTIIGSICWAIPFFLYFELFLIVSMFLYIFSIKDFFMKWMHLIYLLAFVPGLRRNKQGEIHYFLRSEDDIFD